MTTRALEHGADIVFHSATKYLNGHSDVVAGVLVTAREDERWQDIKLVRTLMGGILGPMEPGCCYAVCVRCFCASIGHPSRRCVWRGILRSTRDCSACCIPVSKAIPDMRLRAAR